MTTATPPPQTPAATLDTVQAELAAVTDRLVATARAAGAGDVRMATAGAVLAATDRLTAAVVEVLSKVSHRGVIAAEGLTTGTWLMTLGQRTIADERMLAATAERLADMPTVREWFRTGQVSWPVVRGIVAAVRNLTREQRRWVDDTLAADAARFSRLDAEDRVATVAGLADQARPDLHRDRERRAREREYLRWQTEFDGGSQGQFALNAEHTAILEEALDNIKRHHTAANNHNHDTQGDHNDGDHDGRDGHDGHDGHGHHDAADVHDHDAADDDADGDDVVGGRDGYLRRRSATTAQALVALCKQRLGRNGGTAPSQARPSIVVVADLAALLGDGDGVGSATAQLLLRGGRSPVRLTPAAAQRLACDAGLRTVLTDGHEILGSADPHATVSPALRAALVARDRGCRFPGCHHPPQVCDTHHVISRFEGGPTILDNLALVCPAHHHAIHDGGWRATLYPDGAMTYTRHGITLTSSPATAKRAAHRPRHPADDPPDTNNPTPAATPTTHQPHQPSHRRHRPNPATCPSNRPQPHTTTTPRAGHPPALGPRTHPTPSPRGRRDPIRSHPCRRAPRTDIMSPCSLRSD